MFSKAIRQTKRYRVWGGSPGSDCICRAKPKNRIFANEQFSGHLIFYKKNIFLFFEKKCFFWKFFFEKNYKKKFINFLWAENFWKF